MCCECLYACAVCMNVSVRSKNCLLSGCASFYFFFYVVVVVGAERPHLLQTTWNIGMNVVRVQVKWGGDGGWNLIGNRLFGHGYRDSTCHYTFFFMLLASLACVCVCVVAALHTRSLYTSIDWTLQIYTYRRMLQAIGSQVPQVRIPNMCKYHSGLALYATNRTTNSVGNQKFENTKKML